MNKIYYKSPVFIQHVLTSAYGFKLRRQRYNKTYKMEYDNYLSNNIKVDDLIVELLLHLKEKIPYYKDYDIDIKNPQESLLKLPKTNKEDLRLDLLNRSYKTNNVIETKTGGTTGKSLKVLSSKNDRAKRMAYLDYIKVKNGVEPFSKRASFTGKEITPHNHQNYLWRYNFPMNQVLYASYLMNPENIKFVYENLETVKPQTIDGFPSAIHLIAKYILTNNIKISWKVKAIFPTAETLNEVAKDEIEKAFETVVIDQYASSEGAPFIYSDKDGLYIIGKETGVFEFYKIQDNIYEMVVTSFINKATPIIRYEIGDRVIIKSDKNYLNTLENEVTIEKILGRSTDYLLSENNTMVTSVNLANAIKDLGDKIIQSQFIQRELKSILINLVVSDEFKTYEDEKRMIDKLKHRLGDKEFTFNYVKEIEKEKSGKTRFIINEMSEENES